MTEKYYVQSIPLRSREACLRSSASIRKIWSRRLFIKKSGPFGRIKETLHCNSNNISIYYQNMCISQKCSAIEHFVTTKPWIKLLCFTEHWMNYADMVHFIINNFKLVSHFCRVCKTMEAPASKCTRTSMRLNPFI